MSDYQTMNEQELSSIIENAEKALRHLQASKHKKVIAQIKELAASINASVEITENDAKKLAPKVNKVPIKYRNPNDLEQTWTGRGVMPIWLKNMVDAGHDRSEFEV